MKTRLNYLWTVAVLLVMLGCDKKDAPVETEAVPVPKPIVEFTFSKVINTTNPKKTDTLRTFRFQSQAKNYNHFLWEFGDGVISQDTDVVHQFQDNLIYKIRLSARNSEGFWARKEVLIDTRDPNFDPSKVGENYFITLNGILTTSHQNPKGIGDVEGSPKLTDGSKDTKFCFIWPGNSDNNVWAKFELNTPVAANTYTIISANDLPGRDLRKWRVEGSNVGSNNAADWVVLDQREDIQWPVGSVGRKNQKIFRFVNETPYKFYRLVMNRQWDDVMCQIAEWALNAPQPK
jgi:hypothetical protein